MTNYERIKAMSIEEMVDFLMGFKECSHYQVGRYRKDCWQICEYKQTLELWLKQEVKE